MEREERYKEAIKLLYHPHYESYFKAAVITILNKDKPVSLEEITLDSDVLEICPGFKEKEVRQKGEFAISIILEEFVKKGLIKKEYRDQKEKDTSILVYSQTQQGKELFETIINVVSERSS